MEEKDIRWQQRFANYQRALAKLREVVTQEGEELSELETDGMIQRFEYTYELAWKTLQDLLRHRGYLDIAGPNPVLAQALADGYITEPAGWKKMKKARELSSHTYQADTATDIAKGIVHTYYPLLHSLAQRLEKERNADQNQTPEV
jgi:nucleotidyltransferase substrate binding protein (TIGR01987 family)